MSPIHKQFEPSFAVLLLACASSATVATVAQALHTPAHVVCCALGVCSKLPSN